MYQKQIGGHAYTTPSIYDIKVLLDHHLEN
jgi:hypothetical protein